MIKVIIWICGLIAQLVGTIYVYNDFGFWLAVAFFFIGGFAITILMFGIQKILGIDD